jgi:hypothetical protein
MSSPIEQLLFNEPKGRPSNTYCVDLPLLISELLDDELRTNAPPERATQNFAPPEFHDLLLKLSAPSARRHLEHLFSVSWRVGLGLDERPGKPPAIPCRYKVVSLNKQASQNVENMTVHRARHYIGSSLITSESQMILLPVVHCPTRVIPPETLRRLPVGAIVLHSTASGKVHRIDQCRLNSKQLFPNEKGQQTKDPGGADERHSAGG